MRLTLVLAMLIGIYSCANNSIENESYVSYESRNIYHNVLSVLELSQKRIENQSIFLKKEHNYIKQILTSHQEMKQELKKKEFAKVLDGIIQAKKGINEIKQLYGRQMTALSFTELPLKKLLRDEDEKIKAKILIKELRSHQEKWDDLASELKQINKDFNRAIELVRKAQQA